jgi:hypothetical protein
MLLLCVLLCVSSVACPSFSVRTEDARITTYHSETVHTYLWNMTKPDPVIVADCAGFGLRKVRVKTNYLYWLAGVFTFGGWVPMDLEWRCAWEEGSD